MWASCRCNGSWVELRVPGAYIGAASDTMAWTSAAKTLLIHALTRVVPLDAAQEARFRELLVDTVSREMPDSAAMPARHRRIFLVKVAS